MLRKLVRGLAAGAAVLAAFAGCKNDRTSVFTPFGGAGHILRLSAATARNSPSGSVAVSTATADTTVNVTINNVKALTAGKAYRVWLVDSAGATFRLARAKVIRTETDTSTTGVITVTVDSSYSGLALIKGATPRDSSKTAFGRANVSWVVSIRKTLLGTNPNAAPFAQVLVTIGDSSTTDTTSASGARPLWRRFRAGGGSAGAMGFGNWLPGCTLSSGCATGTAVVQYTFASVGTGIAEIRDSQVTADFTQLGRPPMGYAYRLWVVQLDSTSLVVSGLTAPIVVGATSTSLEAGDSSQVDIVVTPTGFYASNARNWARAIGLAPLLPAAAPDHGWFSYTAALYLTLEPKLSDLTVRGPSLVNSAGAPGILYSEP